MASDTSSVTRRSMLAAGLGALGAAAASLLGSPITRAADGDNARVGNTNTGASTTTFRSGSKDISALWGDATNANGTGVGVRGDSAAQAGRGVWGRATGARSSSGVPVGVDGEATAGGVAVRGLASGDSSVGVVGAGKDTGVYGWSPAGVGVAASSNDGIALSVRGRMQVDRIAGVASIAAGQTSVTIAPGVSINAASFVLLTPKANLGSRSLWFTTDSANNRFTIRMSASRPAATKVAWLLIG